MDDTEKGELVLVVTPRGWGKISRYSVRSGCPLGSGSHDLTGSLFEAFHMDKRRVFPEGFYAELEELATLGVQNVS